MNGSGPGQDSGQPSPGGRTDTTATVISVSVIVVALLILIVYIIYRMLCQPEERSGRSGNFKSRLRRKASKSVAVIVRMPSLADSLATDAEPTFRLPKSSSKTITKILKLKQFYEPMSPKVPDHKSYETHNKQPTDGYQEDQ